MLNPQSKNPRNPLSRRIAFAVLALASLPLTAVDTPAATISTEEGGFAPRFSASDHAIFSNAKRPGVSDETQGQLMNEGNVRGEFGRYSASTMFTNRWNRNDSSQTAAFQLEKATVGADWEVLELRAGDTYQELGRGIALSLYRDPNFGLDTTLQGGMARFKPEGFDVTLFGGRINAVRNPVAINIISTSAEFSDYTLGGGSAKVKLGSDAQIGAQGFYAIRKGKTAADYDQRWQSVGATFFKDNLVEGVDAYLESNLLLSQGLGDLAGTTFDNGYGSYGSLTYTPGALKFRLEGRDYRRYGWEFRRPPTLEEDIIQTPNTINASSAKLYVEHRDFDVRRTLFGSWLEGTDRDANAPFHHGVLGAKFVALGGEFETKAGYRWTVGKDNTPHAQIKGKWKTFKGQAVELSYRKLVFNQTFSTGDVRTDRNMIDLTYTLSERWNVAFGYEYLPVMIQQKNSHYFNGGLNFKQGAMVARAFVGQTSGGPLCSGGVCRTVPPYTGAMVDATYSF